MPTLDEMYAFLKAHYKAERFELRNGAWCPNYSELVAQSSLEQLEKTGVGFISHHEAASGRVIKFDKELRIME